MSNWKHSKSSNVSKICRLATSIPKQILCEYCCKRHVHIRGYVIACTRIHSKEYRLHSRGKKIFLKLWGVVFMFIVPFMIQLGEKVYNICPFDDSFYTYLFDRSIACTLFALWIHYFTVLSPYAQWICPF